MFSLCRGHDISITRLSPSSSFSSLPAFSITGITGRQLFFFMFWSLEYDMKCNRFFVTFKKYRPLRLNEKRKKNAQVTDVQQPDSGEKSRPVTTESECEHPFNSHTGGIGDRFRNRDAGLQRHECIPDFFQVRLFHIPAYCCLGQGKAFF